MTKPHQAPGGSTDRGEAAAERTCCECHSDIEWCSLCGEADCGVALCHGCTVEAIGSSLPTLHQHGG